jgi:hypothetical protein
MSEARAEATGNRWKGKVETMMGFVPAMWVVWGICVFLLAAVSLYSSHLAKNEEDQLFLDDSFSHMKSEQEMILARVSRVAPFKRTAMALAGIMTLFVIGYYIVNMIQQFR